MARQRRWPRLYLIGVLMSLGAACSSADEPEQSPDTNEDEDPSEGPSDPSEQDGDLTRASLADGELQGDVDGGAVRFLKIPYAKPPVGDLRWRAPVRNDPWEGVRHETQFASACPQSPSQQNEEGSQDEDCLYLNVWRPNKEISDAPVMVWIHGGGYTTGSAADFVPDPGNTEVRWYDGRVFAERHDVVVVTLNYRLGVFGFFAHPDLAAEGSPLGNQGLLDQRMALTWVRDNIEAFGGDPENVTIFGQSAGAGSVCLHMVSPGSRGLFHRAIGQSGACSGLSGGAAADVADDLREYAAERGCSGEDALSCLRDKPVSEFVSSERIVRTGGFDELRRRFNFGTVVDGEGGFLPEPASEYWARGDVAKVPTILGATHEEAQLYFIAAPVPESEEEYVAEINDTYGEHAARVLEVYPSSRFDGDYRKLMTRISTDDTVCGIREHAVRAAEAGLRVYLYNFNIVWSIADGVLGPAHAAEISHVFGLPYEESAQNAAVAEVMNAFWAQFAASGDPNYEDAPVSWPQFRPDDDVRIQFAPGLPLLSDFRQEECALRREINTQG